MIAIGLMVVGIGFVALLTAFAAERFIRTGGKGGRCHWLAYYNEARSYDGVQGED